MLTYEITVTQVDVANTMPVQQIEIVLRDEQGNEVLIDGVRPTTTCVGTPEQAQEYALVFLHDLRANYRILANLVLPGDASPGEEGEPA